MRVEYPKKHFDGELQILFAELGCNGLHVVNRCAGDSVDS